MGKHMAYSLKNLPPVHPRPSPPKASRWLVALALMLAVSVILMRVFGRYVEGNHFWYIALGAPAIIWGIAAGGRLLVWMLRDIAANGFDRRREAWILHETRRARRAMQVLGVSFVTGHPENTREEIVAAMLAHQTIMAAQTDWQGNKGQRLSRIEVEPDEKPDATVQRVLTQLIEDLSLADLPDTTSLVVALDASTSCEPDVVNQAWENARQACELACAVEFIPCRGPAFLDAWLDHRIREESLLLIIGLQVAPEQTDHSAEAAVALLLGNRLTQKTLPVIALLHRPDPALPGQLEAGMRMAAYNVPVDGDSVTHLWLAGLNQKQQAEVASHQGAYPTQAVGDEQIITPDSTVGQAGAAAPWLAMAAAVQTAQDIQRPQMIICGDIHRDELWSTLVTPEAYRKEKDS
jgi:hypothetical protein